jgi:hypothetical protein
VLGEQDGDRKGEVSSTNRLVICTAYQTTSGCQTEDGVEVGPCDMNGMEREQEYRPQRVGDGLKRMGIDGG